jgi:hypothetical protein
LDLITSTCRCPDALHPVQESRPGAPSLEPCSGAPSRCPIESLHQVAPSSCSIKSPNRVTPSSHSIELLHRVAQSRCSIKSPYRDALSSCPTKTLHRVAPSSCPIETLHRVTQWRCSFELPHRDTPSRRSIETPTWLPLFATLVWPLDYSRSVICHSYRSIPCLSVHCYHNGSMGALRRTSRCHFTGAHFLSWWGIV